MKTPVSWRFLPFLPLLCGLAAAQTNGPTRVVKVEAGAVQGMLLPTLSGRPAQAYLGIPFAADPSGGNRWKPPMPPTPWTGVLQATNFGPIPPQAISPTSRWQPVTGENCLSINVWTPAGAAPGQKLPVIAYIYGGAFNSGGSSDPNADCSFLAANKGIVMVSFNYRLGALGFLVTGESGGNFGIMDQQFALAWVRKNIGEFGGDPKKVTIWGLSSGAQSVCLHLTVVPSSEKLFRAGMMNSCLFSIPYKTREESLSYGAILMKELNCTNLDELRKAPVADILTAQASPAIISNPAYKGSTIKNMYYQFAPAIDGKFIVDQPMEAVKRGALRKPVLHGTSEGESFSGSYLPYTNYVQVVGYIFPNDKAAILARYPGQPDQDNSPIWSQVMTDYLFTTSNRYVSDHSKRSWLYQFRHVSSFTADYYPPCCVHQVCHGSDLPYIFDTATTVTVGTNGYGSFTLAEHLLSDEMEDYWTNFARDLDPNGPDRHHSGVPYWPRYQPSHEIYEFLDIPVSRSDAPFRELCNFWNRIGYNLEAP